MMTKYSEPRLFSLVEGYAAPYCYDGSNTGSVVCHDGSAADTNGCGVGGGVFHSCHYGDGIIGTRCVDGNSPDGGNANCYEGTLAHLPSLSRCSNGTIVT
jgi:hypothetical protein